MHKQENIIQNKTYAKKEESHKISNHSSARYYNSDLSIWISVDPMSDKYPNLSPYTYCTNNPIILKDPNGKVPRIYCETNGVGHAFITAGEGDNTIVYTYGRYLGGNKNKSSAHRLDPIGRGVLIKLTGSEAQRYIKHELKDKKAESYVIYDASDSKVIKYFDALFANGRNLTNEEANRYNSNPNNFGTSEDARVIDIYNLIENNCVKKTIAGIKAGGTKESFFIEESLLAPDIPKLYFEPTSPSELKDYLEIRSKISSSKIKKVTSKVNMQFVY